MVEQHWIATKTAQWVQGLVVYLLTRRDSSYRQELVEMNPRHAPHTTNGNLVPELTRSLL